jgi:SAM-dependent methyltransferase
MWNSLHAWISARTKLREVFYARWYLTQNPSARFARYYPLLHYLIFGARNGFDPHPLFDTDWYLTQNPDVAAARQNPLVHYLRVGAAEGRDPNPLFDSDWYLAHNPDVAAAGENPLVHYLRFGSMEGRDPNLLFDTDWYLAQNPDVAAARQNPLEHYLCAGAAEGRDPNPRFDTDWYLEQNSDIAATGENPLAHYLRVGATEGRQPNPRFGTDRYVSHEGLSTPLPDAELIFLVNGHRNLHAFDISRRATVESIIALLSKASIDYREFRSILDFGCGCGRILAAWEGKLRPDVKLFGCDINKELVRFCQENIRFAETMLCSYFPPLSYQAEQFDFVYAASVYTHLTLPALLQWTGELARIVKPHGIVMMSYHGAYYAHELARISQNGSAQLAQRGYYVHLHGDKSDTSEGSNCYATFLSLEFVLNLFRGFELVAVHPGILEGPNPFASYQDIAVFRRLRDEVVVEQIAA